MGCSPHWGHSSICLAACSNQAERVGGGTGKSAVSARPGGSRGSSCNTSAASAIAGAGGGQEIPSKAQRHLDSVSAAGLEKATASTGFARSLRPGQSAPRRSSSSLVTPTASCRLPAASTCASREQTAGIYRAEATSAAHSPPDVPESLLLPTAPTGGGHRLPRAQSGHGACQGETLVRVFSGERGTQEPPHDATTTRELPGRSFATGSCPS